MESIRIKIAKDFSNTPGPRYKREGDYSGEAFREEVLYPIVHKAVEEDKFVIVDLDGTAGYGTSFLEEAFGGLIRKKGIKYNTIKIHLKIVSEEEPYLVDDVYKYLEDAREDESD